VLEGAGELFDARVRDGRIVAGHGDLRAEHVCLQPQPAIIDCIEFCADFRVVDPADEIGFLALECERLGRPDFGPRLFETYEAITQDAPDPRLVHFYQSYRAALRARISISHLKEEEFRGSPKWVEQAEHYLALARTHALACA
jgi:aminoglycoside phosphotransferase family enzyme